METPLSTFVAQNDADTTSFWAGIIVLVIGAISSIILLRQPGPRETYNRRMLTAMLCFFLALLGTGAALFSWLSMRRLTDVTLYADRLETGYGTIALADIQQVKVETAGRASLVDPGRYRSETKLLFISERNGKVHVFPEKVYDIQAILGELDKLRKKK